MVNAALSAGFCALGEDDQALGAYLREPAGDLNALGLRALGPVNRDVAVLERRHVGRVTRHNARFTVGSRNDNHVDVVRRDQPVRSHKLKMQIGHYSLPSMRASNARVAASNLSRQPVLQKPTIFPRYSVRLSALTGLPDQGQL